MANQSVDEMHKLWKKVSTRAKDNFNASPLFDQKTKKGFIAQIAKTDRSISTAVHRYKRGQISESEVKSIIQNGIEAVGPFIV